MDANMQREQGLVQSPSSGSSTCVHQLAHASNCGAMAMSPSLLRKTAKSSPHRESITVTSLSWATCNCAHQFSALQRCPEQFDNVSTQTCSCRLTR